MYGAGGQLNAEVGYGLAVGARFVGTPRVGLATSQYGREYQVGYVLGVLAQGRVHFGAGRRRAAAGEPGARRSEQRADWPGDPRLVGGLREQRVADAAPKPSWPASSTWQTDTTSMTRAT